MRFIKIFALIFIALSFYFKVCSAETEGSIEKLFLEGKYDAVVARIDKSMEGGSMKKDEMLYLKGISQLKLKSFKSSRDTLGLLTSRYPNSKYAFNAAVGVGDSYFLEGNMSAALTMYEEVVKKYPNNENIITVNNRIGDCHKALGSQEKADIYYDKIKKQSPLSFTSKNTGNVTSTVDYSATKKIKPAMSTETGYSIQVGSFKNRRNAARLQEKLVALNFRTYIEGPEVSSDRLYRVKVGTYSTKEAADITASALRKRGYSTKICSGSACQ